jgi:hypothetical protein
MMRTTPRVRPSQCLPAASGGWGCLARRLDLKVWPRFGGEYGCQRRRGGRGGSGGGSGRGCGRGRGCILNSSHRARSASRPDYPGLITENPFFFSRPFAKAVYFEWNSREFRGRHATMIELLVEVVSCPFLSSLLKYRPSQPSVPIVRAFSTCFVVQTPVHAQHLEPLADNSLDERSEPQIADAMAFGPVCHSQERYIISPSTVTGKPFEVVAMGSGAQDESIVMAKVTLDAPATGAPPPCKEVAAHEQASTGAAASLTGGQIMIGAEAKRKNDAEGSNGAKKVRTKVRTDGGFRICPHNKRKNTCRECDGSQVCMHARRREQCKECAGSGICIHGREKYICKECGGGSICIHGRRRCRCKECGGGSICTHGKRKDRCKECKPR